MSQTQLSKRYNITVWHIGAIVKPELAEKRKEQKKNRKNIQKKFFHGKSGQKNRVDNPIYDPHRDGIVYHNSITSEQFGDPLPGRSALDELQKKKSQG
jgi:hypothetical protein